MFGIVVSVLIRHKQRHAKAGLKSSSKLKEKSSTIRLMISIIGIMSIFGLTWLFGALTVDKASLAFQVLFVIFNSLQGFFIFLFLCVFGREAREHWLEFLFCGRYKSYYLRPSSATTSSANKRVKNVLLTSNTASTSEGKSAETPSQAYPMNFSAEKKKEKIYLTKESKEHIATTDINKLTPE